MLRRVTDGARCMVTVERIHGRVASRAGRSQQCVPNAADTILSARCW